jgi:hypothetical protein
MSRFHVYSTLCAAALLIGCQKDKNDQTALSETKNLKPAVAIAPVLDNSNHGLPWNLSDELTYSVCYRLEQKDKLVLADSQRIKALSKKLKGNYNPFGNDVKWVKSNFPGEEFVVFLELLEHDEALNQPAKEISPETCSAQLNMSVRLRIIDLRGEEPRITLQEIIHDSHFVPRQFTHYNFHQAPWGSEEFGISPVGIAHAQLIKEVSSRIEDYILLAKTQK